MKKTKNTIHLLKTFKICQLQHINQYVITSDDYFIFQSYDSLIAIYDRKNSVLTVGIDWDYSNTTLKHLYIFIDEYCYVSGLNLYACNNKKKLLKRFIKENKIKYDAKMR